MEKSNSITIMFGCTYTLILDFEAQFTNIMVTIVSIFNWRLPAYITHCFICIYIIDEISFMLVYFNWDSVSITILIKIYFNPICNNNECNMYLILPDVKSWQILFLLIAIKIKAFEHKLILV